MDNVVKWIMKKIILSLIAVLALSSCIPAYSGDTLGKTVGVWGDSIIGLSSEEIPVALNDKYRSSVHYQSGFRLDELQGIADEYAATNPDIVVINAGTNDVFEAHGSLWNGLTELFDIYGTVNKYPNSCVVWVNLNEKANRPGVYDDVIPSRSRAFNTALRSNSMIHIVDWNAALDFLGRDSLILWDSVHPSELGQTVFSNLIRNTIDNNC